MNQKRTLPALLAICISLAGCIEKELPIPPREPGNTVIREVSIGSDYSGQVHFDLDLGQAYANTKDAWCLRFHFDGDSVWMDLNSSRYMRSAQLLSSQSETAFSEDEADDLNWEVNHPDGRTPNQLIEGAEVKAIDLGRDPYSPSESLGSRRVQILEKSEEHITLRTSILLADSDADIENNWDTITLSNDLSISNVHVSLLNEQVVDIEPNTGLWDLYFTQYTALISQGDDLPAIEYLVSGVLSHAEGVRVMQVDSDSWEFWKEAEWPEDDLSADWDVIGYDWKSYSLEEGAYNINQDLIYCIQTADGREFLLRLLDFYDDQGSAGLFTFETLER